MTDKETGEPTNWGEIFFLLHKHCGLNKWEIWEYTLPQVTQLIKSTNKYIEYEVKLSSLPLEMFGSAFGGGSGEDDNMTSDGYTVATEEDIDLFAQLLGGGI